MLFWQGSERIWHHNAVGQALLLGLWQLVAESSGLAVCMSMGLKARCILEGVEMHLRQVFVIFFAVMSDKD